MNTKATEVIEHEASAYPLIEFTVTAEVLAKLAEKYGGITEITEDNYELVKSGVQKMTKLRTGIETHRNELLGDARQFTTDVNDEAKRVTALVAAIEDPVKKLKTDHDAIVKAAKEADKAKEKARTDKINAAIDLIEQRGRELHDYDAEELAQQKATFTENVPTEEQFQEFHAVAMERHESTLARITVAHLQAVARELEAQQLQEAQNKLAKEQADAAAAQKVTDDANAKAAQKLADDRAEFEAEKKATADAEAKRIADDEAVKEAAEQVERDAEIARQAAADALAAKEAQEAQDAEDELERQAMAPDREKLATFASLVTATAEAAPELEHAKAQKLLARAVSDLVAIAGNLEAQSEKL